MSQVEAPIRLTVHGAAGRMGQRIVALAARDPQLSITTALDSPSSPMIGRDAGELAGIGRLGVPITAELSASTDVIIDFSVPEAAVQLVNVCAERRIPVVVATTGLTEKQRAEVAAAAQFAPIVFAPSMSLAVNVAMKLVREAAKALKDIPDGVDVEIVERHHRFKEDAPSGTALKFGQIVADEMGQSEHRHGRQGQTGKRPRNEIGYHAVRTGDNVGEHQIIFGSWAKRLRSTCAAIPATATPTAHSPQPNSSQGARPVCTPWPTSSGCRHFLLARDPRAQWIGTSSVCGLSDGGAWGGIALLPASFPGRDSATALRSTESRRRTPARKTPRARSRQSSPENCGPQCPLSARSSARRDDQRHNPQNKRERRHQNGTETHLGCLDRRVQD